MDLLDTHIFSVIGADGFERLVAAFYKQVPGDEILGPMYPSDDLVGAQTRLREFLIQRFGGPDTYSQNRGHPRLRMRHAPFAVDQRGRDRWMTLMRAALVEMAFPAQVNLVLLQFFEDSATVMIHRATS